MPLDYYDHDGAVLTEQDTDSYGDTDSLASLAAPAEEDGLDVSVYASLESTMVDREETEEMSRLSDELSVLMDDNSPKQVPPSSSPITERYNSEAAQTFASPVLSPSQLRLDQVTDLKQTFCIVKDGPNFRLRDSRRPKIKTSSKCPTVYQIQDFRLVWLQIVDSAGHLNFTATTAIFTVKPFSYTALSPTTILPHLLTIVLTETSTSSDMQETLLTRSKLQRRRTGWTYLSKPT